jgi:hypothetical protein
VGARSGWHPRPARAYPFGPVSRRGEVAGPGRVGRGAVGG